MWGNILTHIGVHHTSDGNGKGNGDGEGGGNGIGNSDGEHTIILTQWYIVVIDYYQDRTLDNTMV